MKTLIFVSLLFFAALAKADVTGLWEGYGTWSYDGSSVPCLLRIRFEENAQEVRRHKGQLECDIVAMESDPLTWKKSGSDLLLEGEKAGQWSANAIQTVELAGQNVRVVTDLDAATGLYKEVWTKIDDGSVIYTVEAQVKRQ